MKIVSSIKTLASNIRFLCTVDMQKQHKLLKQIERTQLRQEDDIEGFGHRLDDMPEHIDTAVTSAMDSYDISQDIEDAVNDYDFTSIVEDVLQNYDMCDQVTNVLEVIDMSDYIDLDHWLNYDSGVSDMITDRLDEFDIDDHIDWQEKISEHVDPSDMTDEISEIIEQVMDDNDMGGRIESQIDRKIADCITRQELSKRFAELSSKMFFSSESFTEVSDAEQTVVECEEAEDINEVVSNANNDPILEILNEVEKSQE